MSDNWLCFVPTDPWFRPTQASAESARQLLCSLLPKAEEVTARFFENPQFIDPGANWSGVLCSHCGADAEVWWESAVSIAAEAGFRSLDTVAPCCGTTVSLNELRYVWPAAFGSFVLEAMNPNVKSSPGEPLQELERLLQCSVRAVVRHL